MAQHSSGPPRPVGAPWAPLAYLEWCHSTLCSRSRCSMDLEHGRLSPSPLPSMSGPLDDDDSPAAHFPCAPIYFAYVLKGTCVFQPVCSGPKSGPVKTSIPTAQEWSRRNVAGGMIPADYSGSCSSASCDFQSQSVPCPSATRLRCRCFHPSLLPIQRELCCVFSLSCLELEMNCQRQGSQCAFELSGRSNPCQGVFVVLCAGLCFCVSAFWCANSS